MRSDSDTWGRRMQERKYKCDRVPTAVIRAEETEAAFWVERLREYQRGRVARGEDPADLAAFYARYGRPEDDLHAYGRARRFSFIGGVVGILLGVGFGVAARRLRRRTAWLPLVAAATCLSGPALTGHTGLFYWGGGIALAGGLYLLATGKR